MEIFELVIALLFAGAVLSAWARRIHVPYPALLALAGAALTLLPKGPSVRLDPGLALALFVAPVLLDAAYDSSPRDLKRDWRAVTSLALIAVALTVGSVAVVARWIVPGLPWPAAIALGAIVAPPDASAASAVLRQIHPPHRVLVIVEGESLFNDAGALLVYRLAVAAAMAGQFSGWGAVPMLALAAVGSVALGAVLSRLTPLLIDRVHDAPTSIVIQFVTTFAVWLAAERLRLSGILTLVVYAILVAQRTVSPMPARLRLPSYAVWDVVVFVLNVLAFILVGLQIKPILQHLDRSQADSYVVAALAVCAAVIVVRVVWVMGVSLVRLRRLARRARRAGGPVPSVANGLKPSAVIAWCGMRGIVTLATALALPEAFPYRGLILFCAYSVVLVTLVVQGVTLTPLLRVLKLEDDGAVEQEVERARAETARAALATLDGAGTGDMTSFLKRKYETRLRHAERHAKSWEGDRSERDGEGPDPSDEADGLEEYRAALRSAQGAERSTLMDLRTRGLIGDDAFHRVEEELDWAEVNAETMARAD
jgi:Na+/H+ antiporter